MESEIFGLNFCEVADKWLKIKQNMLKSSTFMRYEQIINCCLAKVFGAMEIGKIGDCEFKEFAIFLKGKYKYGTAYIISKLLITILRFADSKNIPELKNLLLMEKPAKRVYSLTAKESSKFNNYLLSNFNLKNIGILIALNTGLRLGEVCALRWSDVDLSRGSLFVNSSVQRVKNHNSMHSSIKIVKPKTINSNREVPIPFFILKILKQIKNVPEAFLLSGEKDRLIEPRNLELYFSKISNKVLGRKIKFHDLRHTFATISISIGSDIKTISEILGHSSVYTTLNFYKSVCFDDKRKAIKKLENKIKGVL